mmetsp:Transcript_76947/g.152365  ORF Transcript_76947/g.152365 Transcript_76947/m.152365 type:complete len:257 (-) Transcript_76947:617-1387(-)
MIAKPSATSVSRVASRFADRGWAELRSSRCETDALSSSAVIRALAATARACAFSPSCSNLTRSLVISVTSPEDSAACTSCCLRIMRCSLRSFQRSSSTQSCLVRTWLSRQARACNSKAAFQICKGTSCSSSSATLQASSVAFAICASSLEDRLVNCCTHCLACIMSMSVCSLSWRSRPTTAMISSVLGVPACIACSAHVILAATSLWLIWHQVLTLEMRVCSTSWMCSLRIFASCSAPASMARMCVRSCLRNLSTL